MLKSPPLIALVALSCAGLLRAQESAPSKSELFRDTRQPLPARVADLMSRLSLEQKASLLNHMGTTVTVDGFPIRSDKWNQCLNGVKWDRPTTLFPVCVALAATWNPEFIREDVARVLSDEARAIYNGWHLDPKAPGEHKGLIYRAPVINLERNPYWGRNHEAWGEDPFLTGRMAVAYVRGIQGDDTQHLKLAATLKHYAVNNVEVDRMKLDAKVPERLLREYWLPHFRDAVVEGKAQSLMASYNAINGTPNNINRWLLTDLLKDEWKHEGFVVSDLGGVKTMVEGHEQGAMTYVDAVAKSLMAGCDFSDKEFEQNIPAAVRAGKLSQERLDDALARVLRVRFRLGEFDPFEAVSYSRISPQVINSAAHRAVALKAAQQSIVLLQNREALLPLNRASLKRIAVIGPLADRVVRNNYNGSHEGLVTGLQGLKDRAGDGIEIVYAAGSGVKGSRNGVTAKIDREEGFSNGASVKLESSTAGSYFEFPIEIPAEGTYLARLQFKSRSDRGIFQLTIDNQKVGGPVDMYSERDVYGRTVEFGETVLSSGSHVARFTAVGKNNQSAGFTGHFDKLTLDGARKVAVELESVKSATGAEEGSNSAIQEAAGAARAADVAVVFVGTDESIEQEGLDRTSLGLPGEQEALLKAVLAANPKTIVVLASAGPLTVPWLKENVPAILQSWWAGEEGGHAIADVLFGDVNPAGRLPHTVYASEAQVPSRNEYDITKGFTYMYVKGEPLFPFGHGLSYTTFAYSNLRVSSPLMPGNGAVTVTLDLENTGPRAGAEVVQLYVHEVNPAVVRPSKELRGFQRVLLAAGEKRALAFALPAEKLAYWDEATHAFVIHPGAFDVWIGSSSADIRARSQIEVTR